MAAYADTATAARSRSMRMLLLLALPALASARFSVTAGGDDCAVTDGGDCVTSSGYSRGGYSENEGCTITMDPPARSWACSALRRCTAHSGRRHVNRDTVSTVVQPVGF